MEVITTTASLIIGAGTVTRYGHLEIFPSRISEKEKSALNFCLAENLTHLHTCVA